MIESHLPVCLISERDAEAGNWRGIKALVLASAEAIAKTPDYAKALVEAHGVGLFVIRTGFNPGQPCTDLDDAIDIVTKLGVDTMFLVGAWWGDGMADTTRALQPVSTLCRYDAVKAHESQWRMLSPDANSSQPVREKIAALCDRYDPGGICLTHARFKHAADINSLFDVHDGAFAETMRNMGIAQSQLTLNLTALDNRLRGISVDAFRQLTSGKTLIELLDALASSDFFSRWFAFRCRLIAESLRWILAPTRQSHPRLRLGTNAVGPLFSELSGQDYNLLAKACDFIQPLLGYMRWHVLQPIYMWAELFHERVGALDPPTALSLSAGLFGFGVDELSLNWIDRTSPDEGDEQSIRKIVQKQLTAIPSHADAEFTPVLRGHGLSRETIAALTRESCRSDNSTVIYQGSEYLGGEPPHDGWR